ncbi:MAG: hypothetical protein WCL10_04655 [Novosphingobium sp.]|uniref:hypothetical protein n=1 Tax=Novosphingobium sp. TaxID=1874826 RepID=UPI00301698EC
MAVRYATSGSGRDGFQYDLGLSDSLVVPEGVRIYYDGGGNFTAVVGVGANHRVTVSGTIGLADNAYRAIKFESEDGSSSWTPTKNTIIVKSTGLLETRGTTIYLIGGNDNIVNRGNIHSTEFEAILFGGDRNVGFVNNSGEIIADTGHAILSRQAVHVVNSGIISGSGVAISAANNYSDLNLLRNNGTIIGDVSFSGIYGSQIVNRGTIEGSVTTGTGNDVVDNSAGSISLAALLSYGNDVFAPGKSVDKAYGQDGIDTLSFEQSSGLRFALDGSVAATGTAAGDTLVGFENLSGSNIGADTLIGDLNDNVLRGNGGDDTLVGQGGNDTLSGGNGNDALRGEAGNDVLAGDKGNDLLNGGDGADNLSGGAGLDTLNGGNGEDELHGNLGIDVLDGGNDDDLLYGEEGNDTLIGNAGNDALRGGDGKDIIIGGAGQDYMFGGAGADRFIYTAADLAGSSRDAGIYDLIADFSRAEKDRIDLSALDANSKVDGNQSFKFVAGGVFHNVAGELIAEYISGGLLVQGDTDGDGVGDFAIQLRMTVDLIAADFVL